MYPLFFNLYKKGLVIFPHSNVPFFSHSVDQRKENNGVRKSGERKKIFAVFDIASGQKILICRPIQARDPISDDNFFYSF